VRAILRRTRVRLTLVYTAVLAVVLCVGAALFWVAFARAELSSIDTTLRAQAQLLASGLHEQGTGVLFRGGSTLPGESPEGTPIGALLISGDGRVLDRAGPAPGSAAVRSLTPTAPGDGGVLVDTRTLDRTSQRVLVRHVGLGDGRTATLVLNRSLDEYRQTLRTVATFLGVTVGVLLAVAAVSGYWLAGRAFRPVHAITATARDLSEHSLERRITLDLPPDELGELASTFNGMLARLEAAFTSLRRFTADAAHELRAPLAALLADVEVTLRRPRDVTGYTATLEAVRAEALRLRRTADQLLMLARADAGALDVRWERVDVIDLVEEVTERWRSLATRRGVELCSRVADEVTVVADPGLLQRLLDNLIDNALRHTPAAGTVTVRADAQGDRRWRLTVTDTGSGVDPAIRSTLFARFTRSDRARGRDTGGAGLGLSLCAAIAVAHDGWVMLDDTASQGARFVAHLAVRPPGAAAGPPTPAPG
jgi:two-component system OmpR family sensor kinase